MIIAVTEIDAYTKGETRRFELTVEAAPKVDDAEIPASTLPDDVRRALRDWAGKDDDESR